MPIRKFHSVEEMDSAKSDLWAEPEESLFKRIGALWKRSARLSPRKYPRGVFKFRSIEEMQAQREHLTKQHVRQLRKDRGLG